MDALSVETGTHTNALYRIMRVLAAEGSSLVAGTKMNSEPFREYETSTKLAPQPAFARPAILQSQAAYAGAGTDSVPT
jgi:hypothetical protein